MFSPMQRPPTVPGSTARRTTSALPQHAVADEVGLFEKATVGGLERVGRAAIAVRSRVAALATPDPVLAGPPPEWRGRGPVALVGGFAETRPVLAPMADWLQRLGYDVSTVTIGAGLGCAGATVDALADHLAATADAAGAPVRVIGHSRGGQFARVAARRAPADVAVLLTLGTPFDLYGLRLPMLAQAAALSALGSLGAPGLATLGCLRGSCCATFREGLRAPWPHDVPFISIYSRTDRAVPWRSSHDPDAHNVEVDTSHTGLLLAPIAFSAVATALSAHAGHASRAA